MSTRSRRTSNVKNERRPEEAAHIEIVKEFLSHETRERLAHRTLFVPDMLDLQNDYQKGCPVSEKLLPDLYRVGASLLETMPLDDRARTSRILRKMIEAAEHRLPPPLPSGDPAVAMLALETVANAIVCWATKLFGKPLSAYPGKAFSTTGVPGKHAARYRGDDSVKVQTQPSVFILLDCEVVILAPRWFLDARKLPFPLEPDEIEKCRRSASIAVRDYLTSMVGQNLLGWPCGKPVGGDGMSARLSLSGSETRRSARERLRVETPGDIVESIHKQVDSVFRKSKGLTLGRFPRGFLIWPKGLGPQKVPEI